MSDFRYAPIYGRNPWLMVEDADEVADFFRNSGTPFVSHRRDIVHFGSQPHVYWIESGLVASSATTDVDKVRWIGLFSRRTLLGSVRAIGHGKAGMTLMATAVTDVSGFAVPLELYARWVSENPERERAMLLNCIAKSECQVEGVLVNDLCSVDDRVEIAVAVLFRAAGITEAQLPAALPWDIPVSDIASLVHAERAMTSRAVGRMVSSGLLERSGRTFVLKAVPPAARLWWDASAPPLVLSPSRNGGTWAQEAARVRRRPPSARSRRAPSGRALRRAAASPRSRRWRSRGS